jgi:hypothetical protein
MAIVYQKDAGLVQGLNQGLGALAQALGQKMQTQRLQTQFKNINSKIEGKEFSPTLLQEILAQPGGMEYLQQFGPIIAPVLKEQAKAQGAQTYLGNLVAQLFPELGGGGGGIPGGQPIEMAPPASPIAEANMIQRGPSAAPRVSGAEEARSAQSNVPDISGVPSRPPVEDSNRVGPREQTVYQQAGQAGMGINPPQEGGDAVSAQLGQAARAEPGATPAQAKPSMQGFDITKLNPEQREKLALALAGSPYSQHREIAKILQDQTKTARDLDLKREERNFKLNTPLYEGIASSRRSLPEKDIALERIDDAIQSGDIGRFTDWAADRLGMDPLKSTQAQILESAVKTLFLADLQAIQGGRLNQLIEGNLLKAFQNIGKSPEANQEITETLYAIEDIVKKRIGIFDKLSETYDKAGRELPRNVDKMIDDELNPFVKDKLAELNKVRKELRQGKVRSNSAVQMRRAQRKANDNPPPEGTKWVLAPNGQVKAVPLNQLNAAKKAGGRIVNE